MDATALCRNETWCSSHEFLPGFHSVIFLCKCCLQRGGKVHWNAWVELSYTKILWWSFKLTTSFQTENVSAADRSESVTQEISQYEPWQPKNVRLLLSYLPLSEKRPISQRTDLFPKTHISTDAGQQHCMPLKHWLQHSSISNTHLKDLSSSFFFYSPWTSQYSNTVCFSQAYINCLLTNMGMCVHTCMY